MQTVLNSRDELRRLGEEALELSMIVWEYHTGVSLENRLDRFPGVTDRLGFDDDANLVRLDHSPQPDPSADAGNT